MPPAEKLWVSTDKASRMIGVGTRTLYRFIDDGRIPAYRFGRVIRLRITDVETFVVTCQIKPGSLSNLYPPPYKPPSKEQ